MNDLYSFLDSELSTSEQNPADDFDTQLGQNPTDAPGTSPVQDSDVQSGQKVAGNVSDLSSQKPGNSANPAPSAYDNSSSDSLEGKSDFAQNSAGKKLKPLNSYEVSTLCEQLAILFHTGITPRESMEILIKDSHRKEEKALFQQLLDALNNGAPLHTAMEQTGVFPPYVVRLCAVGTETGKLDIVMQSLADYYEEDHNLRENLKSAVSYPLVMVAMMAVVIIVLLSRVLPVFEQVFEQLGAAMDGFAGTLLRAGQTISQYTAVIGVLFAVLIAIFLYFYLTPSGQKAFGRLAQRFPLTRSFSERLAVSRFASALQLTQASGLDTYTSLDLCAELVGNDHIKARILDCRKHLQDGQSFSEALSQARIFPDFYSSMIDIGARTGNLDRVMSFIGKRFKQETDASIERVVGSIEPTLVIILSIAVGLILLSVILPLMGIMSSIG